MDCKGFFDFPRWFIHPNENALGRMFLPIFFELFLIYSVENLIEKILFGERN
jgi:hypothetical protein